MNRLGEYDGDYRRELAANAARFFRNMLFHEKYYYITTEQELDHRLRLHNQYAYLRTIDRGGVEVLYIERYNPTADLATSPADFGIADFQQDVTTTAPQLAEIVTEFDGDLSGVVEQVISEASGIECSNEEYTSLKESAKNASVADRGAHWHEIIVPAAQRGSDEFAYVLANFLYWDGISTDEYGLVEKRETYRAAARLFSSLDIPIMEQKASYREKSVQGHLKRIDQNHDLSLIRFSEAREIAGN
jgi:hypothetical protein